jgi:hypothetical protein
MVVQEKMVNTSNIYTQTRVERYCYQNMTVQEVVEMQHGRFYLSFQATYQSFELCATDKMQGWR